MKRVVVRLVAFLLIGAAISIAGGWGCVMWRVFVAKPYLGATDGSVESAPWPIEPPEGWPEPDSASVTRGLGYERLVASGAACETPEGLRNYRDVLQEWREQMLRESRERQEQMVQELQERMREGGGEKAVREYRDRLLARPRPALPTLQMQSLYVFRRRSGWPFLCMQSSWTSLTDATGAAAVIDPFGRGWTARMYWERGVPWPRTVNAGHFNLPLRPVGWAFVLNTAFWGSVAWVALRGIWVARRRAREWRGVCVACCYPVGVSDVCTECGRPVRARQREPRRETGCGQDCGVPADRCRGECRCGLGMCAHDSRAHQSDSRERQPAASMARSGPGVLGSEAQRRPFVGCVREHVWRIGQGAVGEADARDASGLVR